MDPVLATSRKCFALSVALVALALMFGSTASASNGHGKETGTGTSIDATTAPEQDFSALTSLVKDSIRNDPVGDQGSFYCGPGNSGAQLYTDQDPWWNGIWIVVTCNYRARWAFISYGGAYWAEWSGADYGWAWH